MEETEQIERKACGKKWKNKMNFVYLKGKQASNKLWKLENPYGEVKSNKMWIRKRKNNVW